MKVFRNKNLLEIRIPTKKNTTALIAMIFASLVWTVALFILVRITLQLHYFWFKAGLIVTILGWFALGMGGASFFVWLFFGRERIILTQEFLITDKPLVFFYRRNFYAITDISNIRTDIEIYKANRNGQWVDENRTVIKFDTPQKLVTLARGIAKEEAGQIILELAKSPFLQNSQFALEHRI